MRRLLKLLNYPPTFLFHYHLEGLYVRSKKSCYIFDHIIYITISSHLHIQVQMKSAYTETSFELLDVVDVEVEGLLKRSQWVCTLCGKPGNIGTLDVLFGPYKVNVRGRSNVVENGDGEEGKVSTREACTLDQLQLLLFRDSGSTLLCFMNQ